VAKNDRTTKTSRPVNDAYTGMLTISLLALVGGAVLLYLDYEQHKDTPPKVNRIVSERPSLTKTEKPAEEKEKKDGDGGEDKEKKMPMDKDDKKDDKKEGN
jgi:hypothetical protein